ncbi:hypothetical protein BXZ70DRAFT_426096 [Cristinia sonorae]|uniref:DUF2423 domain-containing protein n=1 Tax=Cristinia sonorae TaxID=1940300 RepID=A0A8K0UXS3_9AGAR|nr:hypothetical protein BXZ70DRAFT_426096 [Cristinia sonorae]
MAKSTRSKVKRHFRAKKREEGVYAATEAARLHRLSMKLKVLTTTDKDGDVEVTEDAEGDDEREEEEGAGKEQTAGKSGDADAMELDGAQPGASSSSSIKRISTSGPRNSGREQWRLAHGLTAKPKIKGMNRQGGIAARRRAGRSHRRR